MRMLVWNINSLAPTVRNMVLKYGGLRGFLDHYNAHIACFQEVKLSEDKLTRDVVNVEGYESFWACSRVKSGYSGVTTYVHQDYSPVHGEADGLGGGGEDIDQEGRIVVTDHVHFVLLHVYVPNAGDRPARARLEYKLRFLQALRVRMDSLRAEGRKVIAVGDFNIAVERRDVSPLIDYGSIYDGRELALMRTLRLDYPDVWRCLHPDTQGAFTVWDERTNARLDNRGLRLDYVLVSPDLLGQVVSCEIVNDIPPKWSDHAALLLELRNIPPVPPHPPCALSSLRNVRFNDRTQPSIKSMFAKKRPAAGPGLTAAAGGQAPTTARAAQQVAGRESQAAKPGAAPLATVPATAAGAEALKELSAAPASVQVVVTAAGATAGQSNAIDGQRGRTITGCVHTAVPARLPSTAAIDVSATGPGTGAALANTMPGALLKVASSAPPLGSQELALTPPPHIDGHTPLLTGPSCVTSEGAWPACASALHNGAIAVVEDPVAVCASSVGGASTPRTTGNWTATTDALVSGAEHDHMHEPCAKLARFAHHTDKRGGRSGKGGSAKPNSTVRDSGRHSKGKRGGQTPVTQSKQLSISAFFIPGPADA